jgi:hypothetical protein
MFLHVGNNKNIRIREIIGIFDMDNATLSSVTRKFLSKNQKKLMVETAAVEIPKSFILFEENGLYKICFSPLSSASLRGRMNL